MERQLSSLWVIGAPEWNEEQNHYLATVRPDGIEKGQYLNSQNKMSKYAAKRYRFGKFWINIGHVSGYAPQPTPFARFGYESSNGFEYSIILNPFKLTALTMRTAYRYVEEDEDDNDYNLFAWLGNKFRRKSK